MSNLRGKLPRNPPEQVCLTLAEFAATMVATGTSLHFEKEMGYVQAVHLTVLFKAITLKYLVGPLIHPWVLESCWNCFQMRV